MIIILNFSDISITSKQRADIVASIVGLANDRYIREYPESRVIEVVLQRGVKETMDAIPTTNGETWLSFPTSQMERDSASHCWLRSTGGAGMNCR